MPTPKSGRVLGTLRAVRGFLVLVIVVTSPLLINACQITSLVLLLFSRRQFMLFNTVMQECFGKVVYWGAKACGNTLELYGDTPKKENMMMLANHQSMLDIPMIWIWAVPHGTAGWLKWFAKESLKHIPGVGWGLRFISAVLVKRDWAKDEASINKTFEKIRRGNVPTWFVIFPEGTRLTPPKLALSQNYQRKAQIPVLKHVLNPRAKGFWASLHGLSGHLAGFMDITIKYDHAVPSVWDFFVKGGVTVRLYARHIELSDVPTKERDLIPWLRDVFQKKEHLLSDSGLATWDTLPRQERLRELQRF